MVFHVSGLGRQLGLGRQTGLGRQSGLGYQPNNGPSCYGAAASGLINMR
jgi:hypothetical protein